jgi:alkylated DNA repair dioxygenase AlkB
MMPTLFEDTSEYLPLNENLGPGTAILRGFARTVDRSIMAILFAVAAQSPFRHVNTPGGFRMSVAMTNCGAFGWVTDRKGYRYTSTDPETGDPWPESVVREARLSDKWIAKIDLLRQSLYRSMSDLAILHQATGRRNGTSLP